MPRIAIWLWPGPMSAIVSPATLRARSTMLFAPLARISFWVCAATEKGTSWRDVSRFCAVTMTSCIATWSTCCALATMGSPAKPAVAMNPIRRLVKPAPVHAMSIPSRKMRATSSIGRCLSLVVWLRRTVGGFRKCGHNTHLRVAATGAAGSGVLLYVRDRELEYLDSARAQRAMQGDEQVVGGEKPHHARKRGGARRGGPQGVPRRGGHEPTQHEDTP